MINKRLLLTFLASLLSAVVKAQTATDTTAAATTTMPEDYYLYVIIFLGAVILAVFLAFLITGFGGDKPAKEKKKSVLIEKLKYLLTRSTPIEKEGEIMLEHDFDGIKELDNRVPPWFSYLFYLSIAFAVYYMLDYHVFKTSKLQAEEYTEEVQIAQAKMDELIKSGVFVNEETVTALTDASSLDAGREIFKINCAACHAPDGGGVVGPNLTDEYWINGGGIKNIFHIIKEGVPAKGMLTWKTQLNPKQIQEVASYVLSLKGTTPAAPKAPQGDKYVEQDSVSTVKKSL